MGGIKSALQKLCAANPRRRKREFLLLDLLLTSQVPTRGLLLNSSRNICSILVGA